MGEIIYDESEFDTAELIELNKELLRIIEKDVDDSLAARGGFSPWSLLAAMGAVGAIFFGLGKEILNLDSSVTALFFLFCYLVLEWIILVILFVDPDKDFAQPHHLFRFKDRWGAALPLFAVRTIGLLVSATLAFKFWSTFGFLAALLPFLILTFIFAASLFLTVTNSLSGNNPTYSKGRTVWTLLANLSYFILVIDAFLFLPDPTNDNIYSFAAGGLAAILCVLFDLFILTFVTPTAVINLRKLRMDIVLQRISLNDAVLTYRRIKEGTRFTEEIEPEFLTVNSKIDERSRLLQMIKELVTNIEQLLPSSSEGRETALTKLSEVKPYLDSYFLARNNIDRLNNELASDQTLFVQKAQRLLNASGDNNSYDLLVTILNNRNNQYNMQLSQIAQKAEEVERKRSAILQRLNGEN